MELFSDKALNLIFEAIFEVISEENSIENRGLTA